MLTSTTTEIALALHDIGAVKFGKFRLHSGKISPIYIDLRVLVSAPAVLRLVAQAYADVIRPLQPDILAAYPYAGLPIGVAVSLEMEMPLIYPRKEVKAYGTGKQIEGVWDAGQTAVLIEDLITSGKSIVEACGILRPAEVQADTAVVLIDRQQGGTETLAAEGITVHHILTLTELLDALVDDGRLSADQKNEIVTDLGIA